MNVQDLEAKKLELEAQSTQKDIQIKKLKLAFIFIMLPLVIFFTLYRFQVIKFKEESRIAVINYGESITLESAGKIKKQLDTALADTSVKEVLFVMNSPGGSPAASEELSEYLKEYSKTLPVTMYVESIAASGGYYIASAIKPLRANKNAIIGSIGVIMPHYSISDLAKKVGVKEDYLAAGEFKKPISYFKDIDEESRLYMEENLLTPTYNNFIDSVAQNRNLSKETIEKFAQGKIYIANDKRIENILVDEVTNLTKLKAEMLSRHPEGTVFFSVEAEENVLTLFNNKFDVSLGLPNNLLNIQ